MSIERKLLDLANRREQAHLGGGEDRIAKQHAQGKYTARERLEKILDEKFVFGDRQGGGH